MSPLDFAYDETTSLYGQLRQVTYRPIMEDREPTPEELAEERRLRNVILPLHGEHGRIQTLFAIGMVPPVQTKAMEARLLEIEVELGILRGVR